MEYIRRIPATITQVTAATYQLLDFGDGRRLEQWGPYRLDRPDPTAGGNVRHRELWVSADAVYQGEKGKGEWVKRKVIPQDWPVDFDDLRLSVSLAPYKHTGVFPEQQENWRWARQQAKAAGRRLNILNLFAYTGGATIALAKDGHVVTHVDASKPAIAWAKRNATLNDLASDTTRWILEDAPKFVARELRRGKSYDGIILDPPAFGHSPTGKTWRIERDLAPLLKDCCALLSTTPLFILINSYAQQESAQSFRRLLMQILSPHLAGRVFSLHTSDLHLSSEDHRTLSTGVVARCTFGPIPG
jgi:23S rRNA (cytosine1962-C5)-methyltransferase